MPSSSDENSLLEFAMLISFEEANLPFICLLYLLQGPLKAASFIRLLPGFISTK